MRRKLEMRRSSKKPVRIGNWRSSKTWNLGTTFEGNEGHLRSFRPFLTQFAGIEMIQARGRFWIRTLHASKTVKHRNHFSNVHRTLCSYIILHDI